MAACAAFLHLASTRWQQKYPAQYFQGRVLVNGFARAALLTGRYAIRTGATQGRGITLWEVTIAEMLKSIGYNTGLLGKWSRIAAAAARLARPRSGFYNTTMEGDIRTACIIRCPGNNSGWPSVQ